MDNSSFGTTLISSNVCDKYDTNSFRDDGVVCISVVGILLNILCLYVLLKPQMDSIFNRLLILLAVSDLIFLVAIFICYSTFSGFEGEAVYIVLNKFVYMGAATSTMATLAISVERFLSIFFLVNVRASSRRGVFIAYLIPVIILPFIVHAAFFIRETEIDRNLKNNLEIFGLSLKFFSVFVLVFLNVIIYRKLNKLEQNSYVNDVEGKKDYTIMLIIATNSIIMYTAWFAFNIAKWDEVCGSKYLQKVFYTITVYVFVLNSSCNFFIFNWTGRKFRNILRKTWFCSKVADLFNSVSDFGQTDTNDSHDIPKGGCNETLVSLRQT